MNLPDLTELLVMRGAARNLSLHSSVPARALLLGGHRSGHRGRGLEFEEVRPYVAGDDPRSIDWRVTARRGRPHTKLFREERERPVWLLVDINPAMFFGSRLQTKSMLAVRAAALLAWIATSAGDRIGAVISNGNNTRVLPPRSREAGVLPILNSLIELQPVTPQRLATQSLLPALQILAPLVHPGSLVIALSDFAVQESASEVIWSRIAAHSECRWFWTVDALEQHALPNGHFRGGVPNRVWSFDGASVRDKWLAAWQSRETHIRASANQLRILLTQLDTGTRIEDALQPSLRISKSAA